MMQNSQCKMRTRFFLCSHEKKIQIWLYLSLRMKRAHMQMRNAKGKIKRKIEMILFDIIIEMAMRMGTWYEYCLNNIPVNDTQTYMWSILQHTFNMITNKCLLKHVGWQRIWISKPKSRCYTDTENGKSKWKKTSHIL